MRIVGFGPMRSSIHPNSGDVEEDPQHEDLVDPEREALRRE
jgi:hypothetical protein